jgi:hypothetical protein
MFRWIGIPCGGLCDPLNASVSLPFRTDLWKDDTAVAGTLKVLILRTNNLRRANLDLDEQ